MFTLKPTRPAAAIFAVTALAALTTGCSSASTHSAFASLRGFASAAHPAGFAIATTKHAVTIHRHAREHSLSSVRIGDTLHHQAARNL